MTELQKIAEDLAKLKHQAESLVEQIGNLETRVREGADQPAESAPGPLPVDPFDGRLWFGSRQAAECAGVHPQTLLKALWEGKLHGRQRTVPGGRWSVRRPCLEAWLAGEACTCPDRQASASVGGARVR